MKTDVEELSPTRVRLSVEVPFDELKPSLDKAYREVGRQVRIPGFRPGRVPPPVIDRRVGRDVVLSQAVNDAMPDLYAKAVSDSDVYALGQPEVEITSIDDGKELTFTVEVDIRPKFELPDFATLAVTVDDTVVTPDDVAFILYTSGSTGKPTRWCPRWRTRTSAPSRARCGPSDSPSSSAKPGCASSCH